jgi:hypothetical protein
MVCHKVLLATERDIIIHRTLLDIQSGEYKSPYEAEKLVLLIIGMVAYSSTRLPAGGDSP